jgi:hypothetical protein
LAINLAITPTAPMQTIGQKIGLPFLGNAKGNPQRARRAALLTMLAGSFTAAVYALPVGLVLDRLVPLFYGHQYQITEAFCALAMIDAFLRFCRGGPNLVLLHLGMTSRLTVGNLAAGIGTVLGFALGYWSGRMEGVMVGLVIGDTISLVVLLMMLREHLSVPKALLHMAVLGLILGIAALAIWAGDLSIVQRGLVLVVGGLLIGLDAVVVYFQDGREFFSRSAQRVTGYVAPVSARPAVGRVAAHSEPPA